MTNHESAFLVNDHLDIYYCHIARTFAANTNAVMSVKYYKLAYAFALRTTNQSHIDYCKEKLMLEMKCLVVLPPLRFAVGDKLLCRVEEEQEEEEGEEWEEWKPCEVIEVHYRERDDPLHYCAPYRARVLAGDGSLTGSPGDALASSGKGGDETPVLAPVYITIEDDSDAHIRRPGWISLEASRFEARLDAQVEELMSVYCSQEFIRAIYLTLRADEAFCARLRDEWQLEISEPLLYLYRMFVMYRQPLVRTDSGYHIPTAEEVIAEIKAYFYADTVTELMMRMLEGHADTNSTLKMADALIFVCPSMAFDYFSKSADFYGKLLQPGGFAAVACISYLTLFRGLVNTSEEMIALVRDGFSNPIPIDRIPCKEAQELIAGCRSSGHFHQLLDQMCRLKVEFTISSMYQCVFDIVAPRTGESAPLRESPVVFFFVRYCLGQGMPVPGLLLAAYSDMRKQLSCGFLRCANPTCEHNKLDKSTGKVKLKKCSRCLAVIYCSRECQLAHYPDHKAHCKKIVSAEQSACHSSEYGSADGHCEEEEEG